MKSNDMIWVRLFAILFAVSITVGALDAKSAKDIAESSMEAHGIEAFWAVESVEADVEIIFGGNPILDATFTFEAHGPRSKMVTKDGTTVIYDGHTAWISPAVSEHSKMGRFHVWTWPWFIIAPFKQMGDGINVDDYETRELFDTRYDTYFQTFGEDQGDAPDDWYRVYVNKDTKLIDAMGYIVTWGKDVESANKAPGLIRYFDYTDVGGTQISTRYEFWKYDDEKSELLAQKGTGEVSNVQFVKTEAETYMVPEDAVELKLPATN